MSSPPTFVVQATESSDSPVADASASYDDHAHDFDTQPSTVVSPRTSVPGSRSVIPPALSDDELRKMYEDEEVERFLMLFSSVSSIHIYFIY